MVGLTGGIGSGKSTVAHRFAALGVPVVDADLIARELVEPGTDAYREVLKTFGPAILNPRAGIDRAALRAQVFRDPAARRRLEQILHPAVRSEMERRLHDLASAYCVLAVPLLLEAGQDDLVDRTLVVDAPEAAQISRTCARDGSSVAEVQAILRTQMSRGQRLAAAHDVIHNDTDLESLYRQVDRLHAVYLYLAERHLPEPGE